jgi:hypothetical protein
MMTLSTNAAIQALGIAVAVATAVAGSLGAVSPVAAGAAVGVVGVLKGLAAILASFSNPDGTPAEAAWIKSEQ